MKTTAPKPPKPLPATPAIPRMNEGDTQAVKDALAKTSFAALATDADDRAASKLHLSTRPETPVGELRPEVTAKRLLAQDNPPPIFHHTFDAAAQAREEARVATERAETIFRAATDIHSGWDNLCDRYAPLANRVALAQQAIEGTKSAMQYWEGQIAQWHSHAVEDKALFDYCNNLAIVRAALPIMEAALPVYYAAYTAHVAAMRAYVKEYGLPAHVLDGVPEID